MMEFVNELLPKSTKVKLSLVAYHNDPTRVTVVATDTEGLQANLVTIYNDGSIGRWGVAQEFREKHGLSVDGFKRLKDIWGVASFATK